MGAGNGGGGVVFSPFKLSLAPLSAPGSLRMDLK